MRWIEAGILLHEFPKCSQQKAGTNYEDDCHCQFGGDEHSTHAACFAAVAGPFRAFAKSRKAVVSCHLKCGREPEKDPARDGKCERDEQHAPIHPDAIDPRDGGGNEPEQQSKTADCSEYADETAGY